MRVFGAKRVVSALYSRSLSTRPLTQYGDIIVLRDIINGKRSLLSALKEVCLFASTVPADELINGHQDGTSRTGRGVVKHVDLIEKAPRDVVLTHQGYKFTVHRPTLEEYILHAPRAATPIYPKDAYAIMQLLNLSSSDRVLECGTGTGSLTLHIARYLSVNGHITSVDIRKQHTEHARAFVEAYFHGRIAGAADTTDRLQQIDFVTADLSEYLGKLDPEQTEFDAVVLDMLDPWTTLQQLVSFVRKDGVVILYCPNITQCVRALRTIREQQLPLAMDCCIEVEHKEWDIRPVKLKWSKTEALPTASNTEKRSAEKAVQSPGIVSELDDAKVSEVDCEVVDISEAPLSANLPDSTDWICRPKNYKVTGHTAFLCKLVRTSQIFDGIMAE